MDSSNQPKFRAADRGFGDAAAEAQARLTRLAAGMQARRRLIGTAHTDT